jgi:hypothetical protein
MLATQRDPNWWHYRKKKEPQLKLKEEKNTQEEQLEECINE